MMKIWQRHPAQFRLPLAMLLSAIMGAASLAGSWTYHLQSGDVLEIAVAGMPDLKQRVAVQFDGSISLPHLGAIKVAGVTASEARAKIQATLATKIFRYTGPDGQERPTVIKFDQVSVAIVEYRPIYVQGDVMKPGELTYRPNMTVRQAIGASGGYYDARLQGFSAARDLLDVQGEYATLWLSLTKERLLIWRLTAELGEPLEKADLGDIPLPAATLEMLRTNETHYMSVRNKDLENEKAHLGKSLTQIEAHIKAMKEQLAKEEEGITADIDELKRVTKLFNSGSLAMPRITEARRALLLSTTRQVQTRSELIDLQRRHADVVRQLEKLPDQRRMSLLQELQEARVRLGSINLKLRTIGEKLPVVMKQLTDSSRREARFTIFRRDGTGERSYVASGDMELQPGDVLEVTQRAVAVDAAPTTQTH